METTEKIVEAYVRYVKGWATIPNIRCDGQFEIDLLAIDPKTGERYHIETSVSISPGFSKLTGSEFDPALHKPTMRRTIGYFIKCKFEAKKVVDKLVEFGFKSGEHKRIIVTWDSTTDAEAAANKVDVELWKFPQIVQHIASWIERSPSYFSDDTLRTIGLYARAVHSANKKSEIR